MKEKYLVSIIDFTRSKHGTCEVEAYGYLGALGQATLVQKTADPCVVGYLNHSMKDNQMHVMNDDLSYAAIITKLPDRVTPL